MNQDDLKRHVAEAALQYVGETKIIGIGTGSTVNHFIDLLEPLKAQFTGAVSSSNASTEKLKAIGIPVLDLNDVGQLDLYVDGADETNLNRQLIKGGGGALTREKIITAASKRFICIADQSKRVETLGQFPLPVEVIPMAQRYVEQQLVALKGQPQLRNHFVTDNGNVIIDVHGLNISNPIEMERKINNITGVVCVGLFAERPADTVLLAGPNGVSAL